MPIWSEIGAELRPTAEGDRPDFDAVRRKYLHLLREHTGRDVILYASAWLQKHVPPEFISIADEDIQAFMEVTSGSQSPHVDVILHSPGGSPEAAEAVVSYLRSRYSDVRVIVPQLAMSAATMIACSAEAIVMGKHSFLGPTDPQIVLSTPLGVRAVPAQAVLDQFEKATRECADPAKLSAWLPMLSQFGPDLLVRCESALAMSRELVREWLISFMFRDLPERADTAEKVSSWLAKHENFKSHSRHLSRENLREQGLKILDLEEDEALQDLSLSVFHAVTHTFTGTPAVKIVENHTGRAFIKLHRPQAAQAVQLNIDKPQPVAPLKRT